MKRKRSSAPVMWTVLLALAALSAVLAVVLLAGRSGPPLSLHARTARAYEVQGIDVSRHQGEIDWQAVADAGVRFAWIKATEGGDHLDAAFRRNWIFAQAAGLRRGAYHFVYWCRRAEDQAAWFVANVPAEPDALPPVLDVEWNPQSRTCPQKLPRAQALAMIKVILAAMERVYGRRPIIYVPADLYRDVIAGDLSDYPLWVRNIEGTASDSYDHGDWRIWQHSETGRVPGIAGDVDLDAFNGTVGQWRSWLAEAEAR